MLAPPEADLRPESCVMRSFLHMRQFLGIAFPRDVMGGHSTAVIESSPIALFTFFPLSHPGSLGYCHPILAVC
jgi:hypothetical protein